MTKNGRIIAWIMMLWGTSLLSYGSSHPDNGSWAIAGAIMVSTVWVCCFVLPNRRVANDSREEGQ